jgi:hypothetical protein
LPLPTSAPHLRTYPTPYSPSKPASTKPTPDPLPIPVPAPQFPPKHPYLATREKKNGRLRTPNSPPTTPAPSTFPIRCPSRFRRRSSHQSKPPLANKCGLRPRPPPHLLPHFERAAYAAHASTPAPRSSLIASAAARRCRYVPTFCPVCVLCIYTQTMRSICVCVCVCTARS